MRRLRPTDGTPVHRRAARYHLTQCKLGTAAIHQTLAGEMAALYAPLVAGARATEDSDDDAVEAGAKLDAVEIAMENSIRELDGALAQLDRENPALGAQADVFPGGFGSLIDPEGESQLGVLPALRVRVAPFKAVATVAPILAKLDATEVAFKAALEANTVADAAYDTTFAVELAARNAVRLQMESAYGRLRDYYKARPGMAEAFFSKESGSRQGAKKNPANAPASPAPAVPSPN